MARAHESAMLNNLERRASAIEQILPTLATKDDVRTAIAEGTAPLATKRGLGEAIAPLATKKELAEAIAPLATRKELAQLEVDLRTAIREEGERTRRHFDLVSERMRDDVRLVAEGHVELSRRIDGEREERQKDVGSLDLRVRRLERGRGSRRS